MKSLRVVLVLMILGVSVLMAGCDQMVSRKLGGNMVEELPPNTKLEMITWKENSLWLMTRPMNANDVAETHVFKESSVFGVMQGSVTVKESRK